MLVLVVVVLDVGQRQVVVVLDVVLPGAAVVVVVVPQELLTRFHFAPSQLNLQSPVHGSATYSQGGIVVVVPTSDGEGSMNH